MTTRPDYSTWYTKQDAAAKIGVSTKTVEKFAANRLLQRAKWRRPTGGAILTIYAREDVERLATERVSGAVTEPFVVPPPASPAKSNGHTLAPIVTGRNGDGTAILQAMLHTFQKASETSEKLYLTIPEAAEFTGLSAAYIRRACQAGTLAAIRDGSWKIKRAALAAL